MKGKVSVHWAIGHPALLLTPIPKSRCLPSGDHRTCEFFGQKLESDHAAEFGVQRLVDHTHAAATELFQDAIVGNTVTDHFNRLARHSSRVTCHCAYGTSQSSA
jgi:hypothetical protein